MTFEVAEPRLSRFGTPDRSKFPADVEELFVDAEKKQGRVPNYLNSYAHNTETLKRLLTFYHSLWDPNGGTLTIQERELISVVVSHENGCGYCKANHRAGLAAALKDRELAHRIADDHHIIGFGPREQAIVDLAVKLTVNPSHVNDTDVLGLRDHGLTDEQIVEVIEVTSFFNYTNRLTIGIGTRPDEEFFQR
ncbi:putative peroxidase-related enzyme [Actinocorallia herbida]|uniref:Putative peroxidase-related enzyme n=1 Tax=Actinocorallia herbida TaxID=58109 RepID=A0A3N1DCX0_9ACTN|nr:peroxidase-related enzyme [Actinocorallia herbida]ROO90988.1 putative peroxidase-related enzyme [Actinocorallia herbida]